MFTFETIWALLSPQGEYKRRRRACERLWYGWPTSVQKQVVETISKAKQQGEPIHPNPYFAMEDTALKSKKQALRLTLSYADYYARYGTTIPQDGWKMINPTGQRVIYVKAI